MRTTVWTNWTFDSVKGCGRPKCIFVGDLGFIPRTGDYIVVREGFCEELVAGVSYNLITGEVQIHIEDYDNDNYYGASLK